MANNHITAAIELRQGVDLSGGGQVKTDLLEFLVVFEFRNSGCQEYYDIDLTFKDCCMNQAIS